MKVKFGIEVEYDELLWEVYGNRLKELRTVLQLTQDEFSKALNMSKPAYVRYENGSRCMPMPFLTLLNSKYNVNPNWMVTGQGDMFMADPGVISDQHVLAELYRSMEKPELDEASLAKLQEAKDRFLREITYIVRIVPGNTKK